MAMARTMASSDSSAIRAGSTVEEPERSPVKARKPDQCRSSLEFWEFTHAPPTTTPFTHATQGGRYLRGAPMWTGPSCTRCWPWGCSSSPLPRPGHTCVVANGNNLLANQTRWDGSPDRPRGSPGAFLAQLARLVRMAEPARPAAAHGVEGVGARRHHFLV